jgi:hypothetical protein
MDRNRRGTEMSEEIPGVALTEPPSDRQRLFVRYLMAILRVTSPNSCAFSPRGSFYSVRSS